MALKHAKHTAKIADVREIDDGVPSHRLADGYASVDNKAADLGDEQYRKRDGAKRK